MAFIRHPKDFFAGVLFIAFGLGAIIVGSNYTLGTAARMGPGYFPRILGGLLVRAGARARVAGAALQRPAAAGLEVATGAGRARAASPRSG